MELKELTQAELDEGLTVEFVNNTGFEKRHTPVLFSVDENPSGIMKCSTGYWRRTGDFQEAKDVIVKGMQGTLSDYEIVEVKETKIMDVFPFKPNSVKKISL